MTSETPENQDQAPEEIEALSASDAATVVDSIDRNRSKIFIVIVASAIAACAFLVVGQMKKQKHLEAASAYTSALDKGEIAALDAVVVDFPGSIAAGNSLLSKAELQIDQGKPEDAQATLEQFVADFSTHARHAQGIFGLANLYHVSGDAEKAKDYYEQTIAAQSDGELTPLARIRLGDLAAEAGDKETADQQYQESYTSHPGNPFFGYAEDKIALLKIGNPPIVKRPVVEPKPEPKAEAPKAAPKAEVEPAPAKSADKPKPVEKKKAPAKTAKPSNGKGKGKGKNKKTAVPEKPAPKESN